MQVGDFWAPGFWTIPRSLCQQWALSLEVGILQESSGCSSTYRPPFLPPFSFSSPFFPHLFLLISLSNSSSHLSLLDSFPLSYSSTLFLLFYAIIFFFHPSLPPSAVHTHTHPASFASSLGNLFFLVLLPDPTSFALP